MKPTRVVTGRAVGLAILLLLPGCTGVKFASLHPAPPGTVSAHLSRPAGPGPFPAVVLLHGGTGIQPNHPQWASWLAGYGYVAALVDSYRSTTPPTVTMMIGDARGALAYLRTLPFVDPQRIAVMGWSRGAAAALALVTHATGEPTDSRGFRAGVLLYPPGCSPRIERAEAPVLLLIGQLDGGSESCMDMSRRLEARAPPPMVAVLYPNTHHAFDDARATTPVFAQAAAGHIMVQFNPAATADARTRVRSFLAEHLRGAS